MFPIQLSMKYFWCFQLNQFLISYHPSPKCFTSRTTLVTVVTCWVVCCLWVRATSAAAAATEFSAVESDGTSLCTDKCDEFGECSNAVPLLQNYISSYNNFCFVFYDFSNLHKINLSIKQFSISLGSMFRIRLSKKWSI